MVFKAVQNAHAGFVAEVIPSRSKRRGLILAVLLSSIVNTKCDVLSRRDNQLLGKESGTSTRSSEWGFIGCGSLCELCSEHSTSVDLSLWMTFFAREQLL
jgi:hypothetical protein